MTETAKRWDKRLGDRKVGRRGGVCQRYTGERLKDIGQFFGIDESGASQASRRVSQKIDRNRKLKAKIEKGLKISRMKN